MTDYSTWTYKLGDLLTKTKGSSWTGRVVGFYGTGLTDEGYAIESVYEPGSVQIYPLSALRPYDPERDVHPMVKDARDRIEALTAENEKLIQQLADAEPNPYCEICGSCGEVGCGCTHKCKFAFDHPDVEARIEALNAEVARLRELLEGRDKFIVAHDLWGAFTDTLGDEA
jgi:hypothetical protein